jgi:uncharacterized membrane protein
MSGPPPTPADRRELDRVAAFSDGVFAIAITLLVLNLEVPHVAGDHLGSAISDLADAFEAYAIGFAVMGLFWYEHHRLFSSLARTSGRLVLVNLALLATIGLMPFTTAVLGSYDEPLAVALYAGNVGLTVLLQGLLKLVMVGDSLGESDQPRSRSRDVIVGAVSRALVFLASIPVAYEVSESLAKWMWLLLLAPGFVEHRRARPHRDAPAGRA